MSELGKRSSTEDGGEKYRFAVEWPRKVQGWGEARERIALRASALVLLPEFSSADVRHALLWHSDGTLRMFAMIQG